MMFSSTIAIAIGSCTTVGIVCYLFGYWDGAATVTRRFLQEASDARYTLFTGRRA